jgi:hypothetical protein
MRSEARRSWFLVAAALATGCALETPDLALDREEAVTAFCGAMEVTTVEVVDLGAGAEGLPCRLTPGPSTRLCEMTNGYGDVRVVRGTRRPTFTIRGNSSDPPLLALAEVRGEPTSGTVERRFAFEAEPTTSDVVDPPAIRSLVFLPGHGLMGVDLPLHTFQFARDGEFDVFVWRDAAALPERRPQPRPPEPLSWTTEAPVLVSTGAAVCAAIRSDAGYRFQRLHPDPGDARPTPAVPGVLTEGPRPAVIATRFDGLLEIREPTPDCTALRPPVVRVPPAVLRDPLWDGERLYVPAVSDQVAGFAVAGSSETRTVVLSNPVQFDYPRLALLDGAAPSPGRPYLGTVLQQDDGTIRADLYDAENTRLGALAFRGPSASRPTFLRLADGRLDVLHESISGFIHVPFAIDCRAP